MTPRASAAAERMYVAAGFSVVPLQAVQGRAGARWRTFERVVPVA